MFDAQGPLLQENDNFERIKSFESCHTNENLPHFDKGKLCG